MRHLILFYYAPLISGGLDPNEHQTEELVMCVENCYKQERLLQMINL